MRDSYNIQVYRRSKFLEVLIAIRQDMAREADFDTDLFAEMVRSGRSLGARTKHSIIEPSENGKSTKPKGTVRKNSPNR